MQLSVVVITLNEEKNIERCLLSVKEIADEVLVIDSLSTDNTTIISARLGAKIIDQEFLGYVGQRNFGADNAENDWILMLDADEVVSPELVQSIANIKKDPKYSCYEFNRLTNYCGKWIKHCGWYPDKKIRLYNKNAGKWTGHLVHEHWEANNKDETVGYLKGDLLHYTYNTIDDHVSQIHKFTELSARSAVEAGKNISLLKLWLGPKWFFFSRYILKLGFLDGYYGYLLCKLSTYAQVIKYSKIRQYNKMIRDNINS